MHMNVWPTWPMIVSGIVVLDLTLFFMNYYVLLLPLFSKRVFFYGTHILCFIINFGAAAKHDHYVHCINTLHRQLGEPSLHLLGQDVEPNPQAISAEEYQQRMDAAIDAFDVKAEEAAAEGRDMTGKEVGKINKII